MTAPTSLMILTQDADEPPRYLTPQDIALKGLALVSSEINAQTVALLQQM